MMADRNSGTAVRIQRNYRRADSPSFGHATRFVGCAKAGPKNWSHQSSESREQRGEGLERFAKQAAAASVSVSAPTSAMDTT